MCYGLIVFFLKKWLLSQLAILSKAKPAQPINRRAKNVQEFSLVYLAKAEYRSNLSRSETKKEKEKEKKDLLPKLFHSVEEYGERLKDNLSPKQKGDWKDLVLMSLSFAVYVYISQKIVCAYCVWMSMLKQHW
ncbi:hypothetical protein Acr_08g0006270 [Actinidia rufa]|uniref:Uncharacterized protein n=1 Tax=Actinidia rufa TaxID=165716 RepID=A0A7J0F0L4_9ERIC|nr:hypothetical protein Acr_08g0006270 [Actinidia rufa]